MTIRRAYVRSMDGWWRRDPYFVRYMAREATSVFVVAYALILLAGVIRLSQGAGAFGEWLESLASPWSVAFHVLLFAVFAYHTWSWFRIMPKTMPPVVVARRRLSASTITLLGICAAAAASIAFIAMVEALA
jgi:succinate dehydrogenase subunit C